MSAQTSSFGRILPIRLPLPDESKSLNRTCPLKPGLGEGKKKSRGCGRQGAQLGVTLNRPADEAWS